MTAVAAVDIGATSGRVVVARLASDGPVLEEVARFPNGPQQRGGDWVWGIRELYSDMVEGLVAARDRGAHSWGVDSWAIDYGVLRDGELVGPVRAYRDPRHEAGIAIVDHAIPWSRLYQLTGIQQLPFNTINQIAADEPQRIVDGTSFALVPDLLSYWATGVLACDVTNASSTGMVDARTRTWSPEILAALGLPASAFLHTDEPGSTRRAARDARLGGLPLIGVATHDTASAFVGAPIADRDSALVLSLGTWALIGVEAVGITPTPQAAALNVSHELGVDGTVRLLRNVAGMWLFEECRRAWAAEDGSPPNVVDLITAADRAPAFAAVFDVDEPSLLGPGQSAQTIQPHLTGSWEGSRGAVVRAVLESLVVRLAERAAEIEQLLGTPRSVIHVVGGASRIASVMQWLADATGKRVVAGPVEATALGNAIVQWRSAGEVASVAEARALVATMPDIRTYDPQGSQDDWQALAARLEDRKKEESHA